MTLFFLVWRFKRRARDHREPLERLQVGVRSAGIAERML